MGHGLDRLNGLNGFFGNEIRQSIFRQSTSFCEEISFFSMKTLKSAKVLRKRL